MDLSTWNPPSRVTLLTGVVECEKYIDGSSVSSSECEFQVCHVHYWKEMTCLVWKLRTTEEGIESQESVELRDRSTKYIVLI
jgi:hypothetical protein